MQSINSSPLALASGLSHAKVSWLIAGVNPRGSSTTRESGTRRDFATDSCCESTSSYLHQDHLKHTSTSKDNDDQYTIGITSPYYTDASQYGGFNVSRCENTQSIPWIHLTHSGRVHIPRLLPTTLSYLLSHHPISWSRLQHLFIPYPHIYNKLRLPITVHQSTILRRV
jgi:hypothetical protein